jgi:hypothetical protein
VDLPMPGSPPSKVTEPGIRPPPSTVSSSAMPVPRRTRSSAASSARPAAGVADPRRGDRTACDGPLFEAVPGRTLRALTLPFEGLGAAIGAHKNHCRLWHVVDPFLQRQAAKRDEVQGADTTPPGASPSVQ